ncbi:preprotein translocase subunit SecD [Caproicibacter sp.]|uniref:preprotein translocase subunit SecD n=1 Tax=Caproicibacter sp. TaxID=2814884 RepID=UPI0039890526
MKRVPKPVFFIVALLILLLTYTSVFGIKGKNGDNTTTYVKGVGDIRWGIDINGGVEATFSPATGAKATKEQMDSAESIIKLRLVNNNITDYEVYTDYNHDRIIVRFPWKSDEKTFDPQTAIDELSATALVTFREGGDYTTETTGSDGQPVYKTPKGTTATNIILQGSDVVSAKPELTTDKTTGKSTYQIALKLSDNGTKKFADATKRLVGQTISIWMDDTRISAPTVDEEIPDGNCAINSPNGFTAAEASSLANKINAGALPFKLTTTSLNTINPTLGKSSLSAMMMAGIIAFILIALLMVFIFRLQGFVAVISLLGQVALMFAAVSGYFPFVNSFTMTLPGIAGIILSIGMGVDANIITATRIKEELWAGKTLSTAIMIGDKNSFSAIFDGNITTAIVAILLMLVFGPTNILSMIFGVSTTGTIYSFGYTLLIGIIANFVFGVFTTRMMSKSLSGFTRSKWLYGGPKE